MAGSGEFALMVGSVVMGGDSDLAKVGEALGAAGGNAGGHDGGEEEGGEDGENGDDDEEFDQGKGGGGATAPGERSAARV